MQLGELAANRGLAIAKTGGKIGERVRKARPALEQDERCRNARELGDALLPRRLLRRQEAFEEEPVGRQARRAAER